MSKATAKEAATYPELQSVLEHQNAIEASQALIRKLEQSLAEHARNADEARARRPSEEALTQELEDLRAAAAIGEVTAVEAREREEDIARRRAELVRAAEESDKELAPIASALGGLQRRLEQERATLQELSARRRELLENFLRAEAGRACAEYVEAGLRVKAAWLRLNALEWMMRDYAQSNIRILGHQLRLPIMNLPQCEGLATELRTNGMMWFDAGSTVMAPTINESKGQESARIRALGVALD